jgi:hypothetical protein
MDQLTKELQNRLELLTKEEEILRKRLEEITEEKTLIERLLAVNGMHFVHKKDRGSLLSTEAVMHKPSRMKNDYTTLAHEWIAQIPAEQDCTTSEVAQWLRQKLSIKNHDRNAVGKAFHVLKKEGLISLKERRSGQAPHIYRRIRATQG